MADNDHTTASVNDTTLQNQPAGTGKETGKSDAGQDESINDRLRRNPESKEARLDTALDESMDASDPPSSTQPVHNQPAPSSGFDPEAERSRKA